MSYRKPSKPARASLLLCTLLLVTPTLTPFTAQATRASGRHDQSGKNAAEQAIASGDYDSRTNNPNDRYYKDGAHKFYDGQTRNRTSAAAQKIVNEQKQRAYIEKAYAPTQAAPPRAENTSGTSSVTEAAAPTTQPAAPGTQWDAMPTEQLLHEYLTQTQHLNAVQKQDFTAKLPPNVQTELRNQDAYHRRLGDGLNGPPQAAARSANASSKWGTSTTSNTARVIPPPANPASLGGIMNRAINGAKKLFKTTPEAGTVRSIRASAVPGVSTTAQFREELEHFFARPELEAHPEGSYLPKGWQQALGDPASMQETDHEKAGPPTPETSPAVTRRNSTKDGARLEAPWPKQFENTPTHRFDIYQAMKDKGRAGNLETEELPQAEKDSSVPSALYPRS